MNVSSLSIVTIDFLFLLAGVIDEDYRGNVGVVLFNHAKAEFEVKKGDRIAQLICERIFYPEIEEVDVSFNDFNVFFLLFACQKFDF